MSAIRLLRNGMRFWRAFGTRALLREMQRRLTTPTPPGMGAALSVAEQPPHRSGPASAQQLLSARFAQTLPLGTFVVPRDGRRRISLVTDSINKGSLFGGVGTAMILAALLARQRGARLRVITRTEPAQPSSLDNVLGLYGLSLDEEVEFAFAHVQAPQVSIDVFADELFITTSWWTTASTVRTVAPAKILYVLQEDERMFYPAGDDQLRCLRTLSDERVHVAVNTQGLLEHLIASGLPHLAHRARAFEPAFPSSIFAPRPRAAGEKHRLLFYARPNHLRNLFYFGLEVIDQAVARGIIDTQEWEIHFVGAHVPAVSLCDGTVPVRHEHLSWQQYAELAGTADLALSLMFTPHPSYPPLDMAASGAVVVTNTYGNKRDMARYCANVIAADTQLEAMLDALRRGAALALDSTQREANFASRQLTGDWSTALAGVVQTFGTSSDAWT